MGKRVLICGCGYVGLEAGRQLRAAGHTVFGLRRTAASASELLAAGLTPLLGDLTRAEDLRRLPGPFDWIVNCVSPTRGDVAAYRETYLAGARQLRAWLGERGPSRLVYTGSTGVYGQTDGGWVDEHSPAEPGTETGNVLLETERTFLAPATAPPVEAIVLRVAGIYGPGRTRVAREILDGTARPDGDGARWRNLIHRDDVARAIVAALAQGQPGQIYNAADNEPVTQREFLAWFAERLGRPLPSPADVDKPVDRKRGLTNKRVSNRRLREELGWAPAFPSFREGYAAAVAAVGAGAGV